jgi:DNA-binding GntR family transcriptional regulator
MTGQRVSSRRMAGRLRAAIERGDYAERPKLPSALRLSVDWNADLGTAYRALRALVSEGLAVSVPGSGTYAVPAGKDW